MEDEHRTPCGWEDDEIARLLRQAGPRPRVPESELAALREEAREIFRRQAPPADKRRRRLGWMGGAAAGLAAAAALFLVAVPGLRRGSEREAGLPVGRIEVQVGEVALSGAGPLVPGTVITTGPGGRAAVRLGQQTLVRIDGDSVVRLDSPRNLTLDKGALYAESGSASTGPGPAAGLVIATAAGSVTDVGTRFEVRLTPGGGLRVRVREGRVRVGQGATVGEAAAGGELRVKADGSLERGDVPVYGPEWDWVQGAAPPFEIENATLSEFLDWVSAETGRRWRLTGTGADPDTVILHGSIDGLTAAEALSVVLPGSGYQYRLEAGEIRLEPAGS